VLVHTVARARRQITKTTALESSPRFVPGLNQVTFVRDDNLFRASLAATGDLLVQLTDVSPKKKDPKLPESQTYLKEEERKLLKEVEQQAARKKREEDKKEREGPPRFELAEGQSVPDALVSSDGRFAFLLVSDKAEGARTADVPNYVTESSYAETIPARTRVGDRQEKSRLAVFDLQTRKRLWAAVEGVTVPEEITGKEDDDGKEKTDKQEKTDKKEDVASKTPAVRELRWSLPVPSPNGRKAVSVVRAADNKDRWLVLVDPATGQGRVLDRQHDDAWVREPVTPSLGWVDDRTLWFLSESTGHQHLYAVDTEAAGAAAQALTAGAFEVTGVELAPERRRFLVTTNEVDPGERQVYDLPVGGGVLTRLTTRAGAHQIELSPDEATRADLFSDAHTPPEIYLEANRSGAVARQVTTSTRAGFRARSWIVPNVVRFDARDGAKVPARLFTPEAVGAKPDPRKPAVIFIHGAGYLQNAHRYWSQYYREYLFHHLLAERGYLVLDLDYRGSAGYGRDWRTAIATHMGGKDLEDVVDGARYLVEQHGADAKRIGVYGGSYGGFLTLMAMFTAPGTFAAGAALRPVTDWAHYSHSYTSNILGVPPQDAEAYRRSSPLYFAEGLAGALLICHGMVDTNVHFQDSVRLAQRLIELRKENWELAVYPVENHAFEEATSWADEYRRILRLFEENLRD
jgi:dipeptidyl aminopeptidase/acylaminoacyl peptidase